MKIKLENQEQAELVCAIREAAVALARVWDVLRDLETARTGGGTETEITLNLEVLNILAADCNTPPNFADLTTEMVLASFDEYVTVEKHKVEPHVTGL